MIPKSLWENFGGWHEIKQWATGWIWTEIEKKENEWMSLTVVKTYHWWWSLHLDFSPWYLYLPSSTPVLVSWVWILACGTAGWGQPHSTLSVRKWNWTCQWGGLYYIHRYHNQLMSLPQRWSKGIQCCIDTQSAAMVLIVTILSSDRWI